MGTLKEFPYFIEKAEKIKPFWDGLNEESFRTTKCEKCGSLHFPPRILCPQCFGTEISWVDLGKSGTIESFSFVEVPPEGFENPYFLVMVDMHDLGKPILARYIDENPPEIGSSVVMEFEEVNGQKLPVFRQLSKETDNS